MDYSESAILEMLKKRPVVPKKEVLGALKHVPKVDIDEAIESLKKQGYLAVVSIMGQDSISITKNGLSKLE